MSGIAPWGPGHVIASKFRLIRQLGKGGMGSVWSADHLALNSTVAVKIIDPSIASNAEALQRFLREAQAAAALRSPHVVQTFDYGIEDGVPFIAMELLEGVSLAERIEKSGKLSLERTAQILTEVGRAIARAHEAGIIHRDLKPDNIYLVKNDDEEIAKVLDFGIAKATGDALGTSSQTRTGAVLGTPYYMSPEQAEGNRKVDHRTDLWSLAVIAFECVTGRRPFESEALGDLILQICVRPIRKPSSLTNVPKTFDEWFEKATQRDPAQRFQSARDLTTGLRAVAGLRATGTGETKQPPIVDKADGPSALLETGQRPLNRTTGGAGAVAHTSTGSNYGVPPRTSTPVVVGATIGALVMAGIVGFVAFRASGHGDAASATPSSAVPSVAANAAVAPPPAASPVATAAPVENAPEPAAPPAPTQAPTAEPHAPPTKAEPAPPRPLTAAPAKIPKAAPAPIKKADKPAEPAPTKKRVDFGF